ncbi:hypothetical protein [Paenibacillus nasutitermitis]|uniref:Uncharacterized protein n=1 Tax=Paenibacillus nasutitermitis TaxID=1652958 RepID=A0A916Z1Y7_9BACL|nr:hypothetical protein [Paenibacillus nasutitermitis]GGD72366.1 hypothetical protein GCM10010911_32840 [Paenibacillus nasutitermitis]
MRRLEDISPELRTSEELKLELELESISEFTGNPASRRERQLRGGIYHSFRLVSTSISRVALYLK